MVSVRICFLRERWAGLAGAVCAGAPSCISRGWGQRDTRDVAGRGWCVQGEGADLWVFAAVTTSTSRPLVAGGSQRRFRCC